MCVSMMWTSMLVVRKRRHSVQSARQPGKIGYGIWISMCEHDWCWRRRRPECGWHIPQLRSANIDELGEASWAQGCAKSVWQWCGVPLTHHCKLCDACRRRRRPSERVACKSWHISSSGNCKKHPHYVSTSAPLSQTSRRRRHLTTMRNTSSSSITITIIIIIIAIIIINIIVRLANCGRRSSRPIWRCSAAAAAASSVGTYFFWSAFSQHDMLLTC